MFNAPLKIQEHLEFKRATHKTNKEGNSKDVKDPSDLFEVDGKPAEKIYMLGEAGRGKTGQCYQLLQYWLQAREAERDNKELSKWEKGLAMFDILFLVTLRHVDRNIKSVLDMICRSVMKSYPQFHDTVCQVLTGNLYTCKCLIVLDGLNEMRGKLDIDVNISRRTVLMTSRHWKFYHLSLDINDRNKVIEVFGLDDIGRVYVIEKVLVNYFGIDANSAELVRKGYEMFIKTKQKPFNSIMEIPLLLTALVHLWQTNSSVQCSLTSFFVSLLNLLMKMSYDNDRITSHPSTGKIKTTGDIPGLFLKEKQLSRHFGYIR